MRNLIKETNWNESALLDLEQELRYNFNASGDSINQLMRSIAGLYDISVAELNRRFVKKHKVLPELWITQKKDPNGNQSY